MINIRQHLTLAFTTSILAALASEEFWPRFNATTPSISGSAVEITTLPSAPPAKSTIPAGVSANGGGFDINAKPAECTGSSIPYQTGIWVNANQMDIEDNGGWWGTDDSAAWTFSTNSTDVVFGMPAFTTNEGPNASKPNVTQRTHGNSLTVNMGKDDGGQMLFFQVWNTNGTNFTTWNEPTSQEGDAFEPVQFYLSITGSASCAHPIGNTSCHGNTIERTASQWEAYGVDDFISSWLKNNTAEFNETPMIQKFVQDFNIGSGQACDFSNPCQLIDICSDLSNGGTNPDAPRIYLALIALQNLSDLFHRAWQSLSVGESDTMTQIANISMAYSKIDGGTTNVNPSNWWAGSSATALFGSLLAFVPGAEGIGAVISLASSICGMVYYTTDRSSTPTFPDLQVGENDAALEQFLGDYVQSSRHALEDTYSAIFEKGINVTLALQGGQAVNRTILNLDCSDCETQLEGWMEQYLALKSINDIWIRQGAFITFLPYGEITQVDTWEKTSFTESDCASHFLDNPEDSALTICHTDDFGWDGWLGAGMVRLNWYWPKDPATVEGTPNGYGSINLHRGPPGYNETTSVLNTTGASKYTFHPTDAVESSLRGWIQGGLGYEGMSSTADKIGQGQGNITENVLNIWNMNATSPGMFNIPVCVLDNLNYWPLFWSTPNRVGGDYYDVCLGATDRFGNHFKDYVSADLAHLLHYESFSTAGPEGLAPNEILGGVPQSANKRDYTPRGAGFLGLR